MNGSKYKLRLAYSMGALQRLMPLEEAFESEPLLTTWFLQTCGMLLILQAYKSGLQLEGEK